MINLCEKMVIYCKDAKECKGCKYYKDCNDFTRSNELHLTPNKYEPQYVSECIISYRGNKTFNEEEWTNKGGKWEHQGKTKFDRFYNYCKRRCKDQGLIMKEEWKEFQTCMDWLNANYNGEKYILLKPGTKIIDENSIYFSDKHICFKRRFMNKKY